MDDYEIIQDTGEVVLKPKFRSMWSNPYGLESQDLSRETEDIFEEVAPFAVDPKTGKFLNDSSIPKLIKTGSTNVYEKIQSFKDEVDLYKVLEKFAYSGDNALLNVKPCQYGDISNMPDNLNDYALLVNAHLDQLTKLNPELAKMVIDDKYTAEQIEAKAAEIFKSRVDAVNTKESEDKK